jgi:predicted Zn-ribbon and HTH transcriptional regulator
MPVRTISVDEYECAKCGHIWQKRKAGEPRICPECKSEKWNENMPAKRQGSKHGSNGG